MPAITSLSVSGVLSLDPKSSFHGVPRACLDFILHCPVPLVPTITLLGFIYCLGFHIATISYNKMSPHFSKKMQIIYCSGSSSHLGVFGMVFCRMPPSKEYVLNRSERNSFALSCLSFLGVHTQRKNFFRLAAASIFALSKLTNTNFVY